MLSKIYLLSMFFLFFRLCCLNRSGNIIRRCFWKSEEVVRVIYVLFVNSRAWNLFLAWRSVSDALIYLFNDFGWLIRVLNCSNSFLLQWSLDLSSFRAFLNSLITRIILSLNFLVSCFCFFGSVWSCEICPEDCIGTVKLKYLIHDCMLILQNLFS